jgi:hypothetical protein
MLMQATQGISPPVNYQVAPWQSWEVAAMGLPFKVEEDVIKKLKIPVDEDSKNLYTTEAAMFFFSWEEWDPWFHYGQTDPQLKLAHILILKEVCIFYILFILIRFFKL